MLDKKRTDGLLSEIISTLMAHYPTDDCELLIDVSWKLCRMADRDHYRDHRIYMHTGHEKMTICASSSIELLDEENLIGLFLHEIGHIIHHEIPSLYTGQLDEETIGYMEDGDDEVIADMIIQKLFGIHIYYDYNKVQWSEI